MTIDEYVVSKFGEAQGFEIIKEKNKELTKSESLYIGENSERQKDHAG